MERRAPLPGLLAALAPLLATPGWFLYFDSGPRACGWWRAARPRRSRSPSSPQYPSFDPIGHPAAYRRVDGLLATIPGNLPVDVSIGDFTSKAGVTSAVQ